MKKTDICPRCNARPVLIPRYDYCLGCQKEVRYEKMKTQLRNNEMIKTFSEDVIICPWCGDVTECTEDLAYYIDEQEGVDECGLCGKMFEFDVYVSVSYSTDRVEDAGGD